MLLISKTDRTLSLEDTASAIAGSTGGHPFHALACVLTAVAAAAQDFCEVRTISGEIKPIGIMCVASMPSGSRKTSTAKLANTPLHEYEREKRAAEKQEASDFRRDLTLYKLRSRQLLAKIDKADDEDERSELENEWLALHDPTEPLSYRRVLSNCTPEALSKRFGESRFGVYLEADEGLQAMQFLMTGTSPQICKFYDGDPVTIERASAPSYEIPNPRLTAMLMLQPHLLKNFFFKHGEKSHASGIWARTLIYQFDNHMPVPPAAPTVFPNRWDDMFNAPQKLKDYKSRMHSLLQQAEAAVSNGGAPRILELDYDAHVVLQTGIAQVSNKFGYGQALPDCALAYLARIPENLQRLAALFHLYETGNPDMPISCDSVRTATNTMTIFADHFIGLFLQGGLDQDAQDENSVMNILWAKCGFNTFDSALLHNSIPNAMRSNNAQRFKQCIQRLLNKGALFKNKMLNQQTGRLNTVYWIPNYGAPAA